MFHDKLSYYCLFKSYLNIVSIVELILVQTTSGSSLKYLQSKAEPQTTNTSISKPVQEQPLNTGSLHEISTDLLHFILSHLYEDVEHYGLSDDILLNFISSLRKGILLLLLPAFIFYLWMIGLLLCVCSAFLLVTFSWLIMAQMHSLFIFSILNSSISPYIPFHYPITSYFQSFVFVFIITTILFLSRYFHLILSIIKFVNLN